MVRCQYRRRRWVLMKRVVFVDDAAENLAPDDLPVTGDGARRAGEGWVCAFGSVSWCVRSELRVGGRAARVRSRLRGTGPP